MQSFENYSELRGPSPTDAELRLPGPALSGRLYLPLRKPLPREDHGSTPIPLWIAAGMTSYSTSRTTRLYCCCRVAGTCMPTALAVVFIDVFDGIGNLPVFRPTSKVLTSRLSYGFKQAISESDGLVNSNPEYVRSIPGGLKNAVDWLVSGDQVIGKAIALVHRSHRGDDMLNMLRTVLSTVSSNVNESLFFRLPVMKDTPGKILEILEALPTEKWSKDFSWTSLPLSKSKCRWSELPTVMSASVSDGVYCV